MDTRYLHAAIAQWKSAVFLRRAIAGDTSKISLCISPLHKSILRVLVRVQLAADVILECPQWTPLERRQTNV